MSEGFDAPATRTRGRAEPPKHDSFAAQAGGNRGQAAIPLAPREPKKLLDPARVEGGGSRGNHGFPRATAGRVNEPRAALVEAGASGVPSRVNRQDIAIVREEWRVVDRWWTEEPVHRRYFEVVLEGGQSTVVFRDEERGGWFSQRGA
jgi:hypothetical protein